MKAEHQDAIAIVGMAGRMPACRSLDAFWEALVAGRSLLSEVDEEALIAAGVPADIRRDPRYQRVASSMAEIDRFDHAYFGYALREAGFIDPQQRVLLELAHEAFEHAGYVPETLAVKVGVYLGSGYCNYLVNQLAAAIDPHDQLGGLQILLGNDKDYAATRVSYKLNLNGPSVAVNSACSTSLVAVHLACRALQSFECDMALAGAAKISIPNEVGYLAQEGGISSKDGQCRPYDAAGSGPVFGSGAGVVLLKRVEDAIADHDHIYALIRGGAVNNDGAAKVSFSAPSAEGQIAVIADALADAGVAARDVAYVEGHGTGTALGDPIEVAALAEYYRAEGVPAGHCFLGSVKANVGHLEAAAGMAGLFKTVYALQRACIPPQINFGRPNPAIQLARTPFAITTSPLDWPARDEGRRIAAISSFGIGGTNAHLLLESFAEPDAGFMPRGALLIPLSAGTPEGLARLREAYVRTLTDLPLAQVALTAACGRRHHRHRLALVGDSRAALLDALASPLSAAASHPGAADRRPPLRLALRAWKRAADGDGSLLGRCLDRYRADIARRVERETGAGAGTTDAASRNAALHSAVFISACAQLAYALWLKASGLPLACVSADSSSLAAACLACGVIDIDQAVRALALRHGLINADPLAARDIELKDAPLHAPDGRRISQLAAPACWLAEDSCIELPEAGALLIGRDAAPAAVNSALLGALASAYEGGADIDWAAVYRGAELGKIALPTYPFARTRCWVDAPRPVERRQAPAHEAPVAAEVIAHVARFARKEAAEIHPDTQFQRDLMMESMMLAEFNASLAARFGRAAIPLSFYFEGGSVGGLIAQLMAAEGRREEGAGAEQGAGRAGGGEPAREDSSALTLDFLAGWQASSAFPALERIERRLAHKALDQNVLVARTAALGGDLFVAEIVQDLAHAYYYEHPQDHVPGLYLIEAARQAATALVHLHYQAPFGCKFIMNDLASRFAQFAELDAPLFLELQFASLLREEGRLARAAAQIKFIQKGRVIGSMEAQAVVFSAGDYADVRDGLAVIAG